jgi:molybdopterin converting factor small subunit
MSVCETLKINVKLFATFRVGRFVAEKREYPVGTRIVDIIRELRIPEPEIGIIMLNSRHAEPDQQLKDGDNLGIFPQVGGG